MRNREQGAGKQQAAPRRGREYHFLNLRMSGRVVLDKGFSKRPSVQHFQVSDLLFLGKWQNVPTVFIPPNATVSPGRNEILKRFRHLIHRYQVK
jgi:hypothetical protein